MSRKDKKNPREKQNFTAVTMRTVLAVSLVVILLAMGGGFYLAYNSLRKTAQEVAETQTQAQTSDARVQNLVLLQKQLEKNSFAYERAQQIVAESKSYQYQNQIITDLTFYAHQANVGITSFTFQDSAAAASSTQSSTPATSQSTNTSDEATSGNTSAAPVSSLKSTQVSIQLSEGVAYQDLLHFLYLIEQNLTRMQVSDVTMAKGEAAGAVSTQTLNIEVYIR